MGERWTAQVLGEKQWDGLGFLGKKRRKEDGLAFASERIVQIIPVIRSLG